MTRCIGSSKKCSSSRFLTRRPCKRTRSSARCFAPLSALRATKNTHIEQRSERPVGSLEVAERAGGIRLIQAVTAVMATDAAHVSLDDIADGIDV